MLRLIIKNMLKNVIIINDNENFDFRKQKKHLKEGYVTCYEEILIIMAGT